MVKILITGASGFVGSFLVEEALKRAYSTYAGVRKTSNLRYLSDSEISFFNCDFSDKEDIKKELAKQSPFDYIIHNAGITKTCRKEDFNTVNYQYTKNLIEAIKESKNALKKFVYISSLAAQGPGKTKTNIPVSFDDKPRPKSFYGLSKLKSENYIKSAGLDYLIFRPTGVYGPREKDYLQVFKSINKGIETFVGSSEQYISFIYVKDLCRLIFDAIESDIINKSYFVSDLKTHTTKGFNRIVKKELNKKTVRIVFPKFFVRSMAFLSEKCACAFNKVPTLNTEKVKDIVCDNWLCDSSDLVKDFGFKPEYNLRKGVAESISWYKENQWL